MSFLDVIGFGVSGALTLLPFLISHTPDATLPDRTIQVKIGAGISPAGNSDDGDIMGSIPGVTAFDIGGTQIALTASGDHIETLADVQIIAPTTIHDDNPEYLSVTAGKDAICIAYVTVTTAQKISNTWTGDIGKVCGGFWYASALAINANDYTPACLWLNGDASLNGRRSDSITYRGFGMHIKDFGAIADKAEDLGAMLVADAYQHKLDTLCKSQPRFWMYNELSPNDMIPYFSPPLSYKDDGSDADPSAVLDTNHWKTQAAPPPDVTPDPLPAGTYRKNRRSQKSRSTAQTCNNCSYSIMPGHLIASKFPSHSAIELCDSDKSFGPDFVSYQEQMYCDMTHKQAYPLCTGNDVLACFDLNSNKIRPAPGIHPRDQAIPEKSYHKIVTWGDKKDR